MEKEELLQNLAYTKKIIVENDKLQNEWIIIHQKPLRMSKIKWVGITIIIAIIINSITHFAMGVLGLSFPWLGYFYNKAMVKRKVLLNKSRISSIEQLFTQLSQDDVKFYH